MTNTPPLKSRVQARRDRVKALALKGKSTGEISRQLNLTYQTTRLDLKTLGIIPASNHKLKENA